MPPRDSTSAARSPQPSAGSRSTARWWGDFQLAVGEAGLWEVGPLALGVERRPSEWWIGWSRDPQRDLARSCQPLAPAALSPASETARFAVRSTMPGLRILPVLPDRPVVARPESPFHLLPGEEVALHVAVPVWLRLLVDGERELLEVASERQRETWLGSSTVAGELCWVTRLPARLRRDQLARGGHHALVAVTLQNRADAPLVVERVSVPVLHLALWAHPQQGLLASNVTVERDAQGGTVRLQIADEPPASGAELVAPGRQPEPRLGLVRALEALLG